MKRDGLTRREMMIRSAALAGVLPWATAAAQDTPEAARRRRPQGFLIGACDWNLGKMGDPGSFEVARQIGLDGVQVSLGTAANDMHLREPEVQKTFLEASKAADVRIASLAIGELNNIPYKSDPRTEAWVSDCIDVCRALRVRVVLLAFFGNGDLRDDPKGVDTVVERLKKVAPRRKTTA